MHSDHAPGRKRLPLLLRGAVSAAQKEWLEFQPLPQATCSRLSLQHHAQLASLYVGAGSLLSLQLIMRVALASAILQELGYGHALPREIEEYEALATQALQSGSEGCYRLSGEAYAAFAGLLIYHDRQLATAPLKAFAYAAEKLDRYGRPA
ncbi:Fis family transcriptional regulator [Janthinobacterium sp. PC23-8]|uniref:Fis family transcriptional regulator n=1 Tax=Janthinobacterium sp. PC23-8 TaxID=2012679 RepID=UPI0011401FDC|nr:Fis family transcriptional regulator [Janthinobacterium sp. PC23-8]